MVSCESLAIILIITSVACCLLYFRTQRHLETLLGIVPNLQVEAENKQFLPLRLCSSNQLSNSAQNKILSTEYFFWLLRSSVNL